jgi:uncharacterized protein
MSTSEHKYTNHLIHESSPYLLQHAHNPVDWYPWSQEALNKAKKENKNLLISIGYAACHWCHVMERECFEDEEVARYMNEHFVAIKVDREERPDIDQIYMTAVQLLTERGGWPLNCVALPDGRPIYGGTYFPKAQWLDMLNQVSGFIQLHPDKTENQARALTEGVQNNEMIYRADLPGLEASVNDLEDIFYHIQAGIDTVNGGYGTAPKFPMPSSLQFLLHFHHLSGNNDALNALTTTLDRMAFGGIYDQIGGGFARYATDQAWKIPHFEKMLYDNAQLVSVYASAFQYNRNPQYEKVLHETLEFVSSELTSPDGGFYSSLDADSEGVEGKFYVWTFDELQTILGENAGLIMDYFQVTAAGNWEHSQNILYRTGNDDEIARKYNLITVELTESLTQARKLLQVQRVKRQKPILDDKILTSWNALMLKGYCDAYQITAKAEYLQTALRNANFILRYMKSADNGLFRNYKNGKASIPAFLDDYAFTIQAFITLYQNTFDEQWLVEASELTEYTVSHFYDPESGMFYYTSDTEPALIARKMEISDNVIPSSNSEMGKNLFVLGHYFYNDQYITMSEKMLNNVRQNALQGGIYYANWDILMGWFASAPYEVSVVGKDSDLLRKELNAYYLPNIILSGTKSESNLPVLEGKWSADETLIYVCRKHVCQAPVSELSAALQMIKQANI